MKNSNKILIHLGIGLPVLVAALDLLAIGVSLKNIMNSYFISILFGQWLLTAFMIGNASFLPVIGDLCDVFGLRKMLIISFNFFILFTLTIGIFKSLFLLVILRGIQGLFASILVVSTMGYLKLVFKDKSYSNALGIWGSFVCIGVALGPVWGGVLTQLYSWRLIFLSNILFYIITLPFIIYLPKFEIQKKIFQYEILPSILNTIILISLVIYLTHFFTKIYLLLIILAIVFIKLKYRKIPKQMLNQNYIVASIMGSFSYFFMYSWLIWSTFYLQDVYNLKPFTVGLLLLPYSFGMAISATITGKLLSKFNAAKLITIAFLLIACISIFRLAIINMYSNIPFYYLVISFIFGSCISILNTTTLSFGLETINKNNLSKMISNFYVIRWIGGILGIVYSSILIKHLDSYHATSYFSLLHLLLSLLILLVIYIVRNERLFLQMAKHIRDYFHATSD